MAFDKKTYCLQIRWFGESKADALTGKNRTTTVHRGSLAFMTPELIIQELPIASAGTDELKTVDVWALLMTFFTILNPN